MRNRICWIMSVVCLTIFCLAGSLGAVVYRYQDLTLQGLNISGTGSNPASIKAINDSAWLIGKYYNSASSNYQPFVWRPGVGRTDLQNPSYPITASAQGLNNQGQIVGQAYGFVLPGYDACYWSSPAAAPVELPGAGFSLSSNWAYGINEAGQVAGKVQFGDPMVTPGHAALWPANHSSATDLGTLGGSTSSGKGINSTGWVVGEAFTAPNPSVSHACLWVPGQQPQQIPAPTSILPVVYSYANVITDQAKVLGHAMYGTGLGMAFFWDHQTGVSQLILPDAYSALASGMSEANQVVGWYEIFSPNFSVGLFYWTPGGGQQNLNQMVVNLPAGVTLSSADAISRNGKYITGFDSQGHPYLLTACAYVPITMLLLD